LSALTIAFVDWYKSSDSTTAAYAIDKETILPVVEPMTKKETNKLSKWVLLENVDPVNIMLGKLPGVRGYFAIRMG